MRRRSLGTAVDALYAPQGEVAWEHPSRPRAPGVVQVRIPLRTRNPVNGSHGHWTRGAKRRQRERGAVVLFLNRLEAPSLPCLVTLARVAPCMLDDDNLRPALKSVRDEVARWLGLPQNKRGHAEDRDPRVHWDYQQGQGTPREYAVIVRAETTTQAAVDAKRRQGEWRAS